MIKIYNKIKAKYPDAVVLILCDDFYITFNEDADTLKTICGYNKSFNADRLCDVIALLVNADYKVAVCEPDAL